MADTSKAIPPSARRPTPLAPGRRCRGLRGFLAATVFALLVALPKINPVWWVLLSAIVGVVAFG
jgi:hypothetical protein